MRVGLFLAVLALCAGCISERMGYAALDVEPPRPGATYHDAVTTLGNPMTVRDLPDGSTEISFWGVRLLRLGNTETVTQGRRLVFDAAGRLTASWPVGEGDPPWGVVPFGR